MSMAEPRAASEVVAIEDNGVCIIPQKAASYLLSKDSSLLLAHSSLVKLLLARDLFSMLSL